MKEEINNTIINKVKEIFLDFPIRKKTVIKKIAVAVSGGCDSLCLTVVLNEFCKQQKINLTAITVDHQIRPNSNLEAINLNKVLEKLTIEHKILTIPKNKIPQKNIEANLRDLRYEILTNFCKENKIDFLFVGHHLGDIAENFLIRLFRGSGLDGLSPIKKISEINGIKIIRPFTEISKNDLKKYLIDKEISWFEDESNDDEKFLRNKIRKFLASLPKQDIIEKRIKSTSEEIAKIRDEFDDIMNIQKPLFLTENEDGSVMVNKNNLPKINQNIALKALAIALMKIGNKKYKPRKEKLIRFYNYLKDNKTIKRYDFYGCTIKDYDNQQAIISSKKI